MPGYFSITVESDVFSRKIFRTLKRGGYNGKVQS